MGKQEVIILAVTNKEIRDKIAVSNCKIGGWPEGFDPFYGARLVPSKFIRRYKLTETAE